MPVWPRELPCRPVAGTLQVGIEPNVVEFKADVGRPQRSKRYTQSRRPYVFEIFLTAAQRVVLDDFFDNECAGGVKSFAMRDLADLTATPATKTFTWTQPPACRQIAPGHFQAQVSLVRET